MSRPDSSLSPAWFRMEVLRDVINERNRQEDLKAAGRFPATCADSTITDETKCAVLTEENGEVARVLCERASGRAGGTDDKLYEELVQVAAVAIAWCEALQYKRHAFLADKTACPDGACVCLTK